MELFGLFGRLAFSLASLAVGVRLLLLARRTRQLPEFLLGASFITAAVIGQSLGLIPAFTELSADGLLVINVAGRLFTGAGALMIAFTAYRVFRAPHLGPRLLLLAIGLALGLYVVWTFVLGSLSGGEQLRSPWWWFTRFGRLVPYAWLAFESVRLRAQMARRWRLGVAAEDRELSRRLLLWAVGMGAIALLYALVDASSVLRWTMGYTLPVDPIIAGLGLVCAVSLWFAFFPWRRAGRAVVATSSVG